MIETEEWRDIKDYEGLYQVSSQGRVKSLPKEWITGTGGKRSHNGKVLKGGYSRGYHIIGLRKGGILKNAKTHTLVATAFLNHKPNGTQTIVVDHIDNNQSNNEVTNLQLISHRSNCSKDKKGYSSKFIGVSWHKGNNRWSANITIDGKWKFLGSFKDELDASNAYQTALNNIIKQTK